MGYANAYLCGFRVGKPKPALPDLIFLVSSDKVATVG